MTLVYIAVGSNLGKREENIRRAKDCLSREPEVQIVRESSLYETEPVGGPFQGKYFNAVWECETSLTARGLLVVLLAIEKRLGRERSVKNAPRIIDLDILFYGSSVIEEKGLRIPHPRFQERFFVLEPLCELIPEWRDPVSHKMITDLLEDCREKNK
ncbi:MAG: 2-amino-4-hydroxy-6-hydroxymethyldihydropteridine diphosphokinase [Candidatus Omnitrophica bacterium]|nr:2-amino-4-hydroxy-6-hydroxymethyldihydropteridine diphosphokinase [Candidatus Omnitrophota bacterium]